MKSNLRCTRCGIHYYSAAPEAVARGESCECGGELVRTASAIARKPVGEPDPGPGAAPERARRFARLARRLSRWPSG
jgi:hypothetical protein